MSIRERWSDFSMENPSARMFLLGGLDFLVAAAFGLAIWAQYTIGSVAESLPPACSNRFGSSIDCGSDQWARITAWAVFGGVMFLLWGLHGWRGRRMRL